MKFKLSVLTLLVLGLIFAGSAFAADRLAVTLNELNNKTYTMFDGATFNGVPMLRMKITNEYSLKRTITGITLTAGTNTGCAGGTFEVQIFQDVNENGILDVGDKALSDAVANTMTAAAADQTIPLTVSAVNTFLDISGNSSEWIIVNVNVAQALGVGDKLELIWDEDAAGTPETGMTVNDEDGDPLTAATDPALNLADTTTLDLIAGDEDNVPAIIMSDASAGTVTMAAATPVAARDIGNKEQNAAVVGFKLTSDATYTHVVNKIDVQAGATNELLANTAGPDDIGSAYLYIDKGTIGDFDASDIRVGSIDNIGLINNAFNDVFDLDTVNSVSPVFLAADSTVSLLVVMNLTGNAGQDGNPGDTDAETLEILAVDVDAANSRVDGGTVLTDGDGTADNLYKGPDINAVPLYLTKVETTDFDGNGMLDALKLTFSENVNDSRWSSLGLGTDVRIYDSAGNDTVTELAFDSTVGGDTANNSYLYAQFSSTTMPSDDRFTDGLPRIAVIANNTIWNVGGNKSLLAFAHGDQDTDVGTADKAPAVVTGAYTGDVNGNGKVDQITVSFSEDMLTDNAKSYPGVSFASAVSTFGVGGTYTPSSGTVTGSAIIYTVPESGTGVYDSEAAPAFRYNPSGSTTNLKDVEGNEVKEYGAGGLEQQSATVDQVPPYVVSAVTKDMYTDEHHDGDTGFEEKVPNGRIETIELTFSERVTAASKLDKDAEVDAFIGQFTIKHLDGTDVNVTKWLTVGATTSAPIKPAPVIANSGTYGSSDTNTKVTIYTREQPHNVAGMTNGGDTGVMFRFVYGQSAGNEVVDLSANANKMLNVNDSSAISKDSAAPFIVDGLYQRDGATIKILDGMDLAAIQVAKDDDALDADDRVAIIAQEGGWDNNKFGNIRTVDSNAATAGSDSETGDGYIDGFHIYFSEKVHITDAATITDAFTVKNTKNYSEIVLDIGVDATKDGKVEAADDNYEFDNAVFMGTSSKVGGKYDTGLTPTVKFNGGITIYDGTDIEYKAADNILAETIALASFDNAKPVPVSAIGSVNLKTIAVTWSEDVYSNDAAGEDLDLVASNAVFGYDDADDAGAGDLSTTEISYTAPVMTITVDEALTVADVEQDSIWVKNDDKVYDNAIGGGDFLVAFTQNKAAWNTLGVGYKIIINDVIAPTIISATTLDVDGNGFVDHVKFVFSEDMDDTKLKSYYAINTVSNNSAEEWILAGYTGYARFNLYENTDIGRAAAFEKGAPVFTDNDPNDNILYLGLRETEVPLSSMGTTAWAPELTFSGVTLADKKPNTLDTSAPIQVKDGVGPVAMQARTLTETTLEVAFSEEVNLTTINSGDFDWTLGEALEDFQKFIAAISQPEPGVVVLETIEGYKWEPYMGGTIAYVAHVDAAKQGIADLQVDKDGKPTTMGTYSATKAYANVEWYKKADGTVDATVGKTATSLTISTEDIVVEVEEAAVPTAYALSENYPNPFNPTTTIEFAIPVAGNVELIIYNINGQKVRTLVNETKDAGFFHMTWDGRNDLGETVSSGIYLYRLVSGNFNKMEKMTFIK